MFRNPTIARRQLIDLRIGKLNARLLKRIAQPVGKRSGAGVVQIELAVVRMAESLRERIEHKLPILRQRGVIGAFRA